MLGILVESAVRSLALAAAVWFGLWLVRAQHARLQSMGMDTRAGRGIGDAAHHAMAHPRDHSASAARPSGA